MIIFYRILLCTCFFTSIASAQILFQERFTNGTPENSWLSGFNGDALEPYAFTPTPSGDGWVGRLLNQTSGGNVAQSSADNYNFTDFYYEAMVYIPVNEATYYGIEFRVDPTGLSTGYQFIAAFNPSGTQRMRFRVRPGSSPAVPVAIMDWPASEIPGGVPTTNGWHRLAVKAAGPHFWFYYDGQEMPGGLVFDQTYSSGTVGVYLWDMLSSNQKLLVDDMKVTVIGTSAVEPNDLPVGYTVSNTYPNPVIINAESNEVNINLTLTKPSTIDASLCDVLGKVAATKQVHRDQEGTHLITFSTEGLPAGMYFIRTIADGVLQMRKVMLIR